MSIWINKTSAIFVLAGLAACQDLGIGAPSRDLVILDGAVIVAPPKGYCVDPTASMAGADTAVVLMGRCAVKSDNPPALLTASFGAAGSAAALSHGPVELTNFFGSPEGRAMLAASGDADDVTLDASQSVGETLFLRINDRTSGAYWRAFSALQGRLLTLTAAGVDEIALDPDDGRALLEQSLLSLQTANPTAPAAKAE